MFWESKETTTSAPEAQAAINLYANKSNVWNKVGTIAHKNAKSLEWGKKEDKFKKWIDSSCEFSKWVKM